MALNYPGPRVAPRIIRLEPGQTWLPDYPGNYFINLGLYANVQRLDPSTGNWRYSGDGTMFSNVEYFDGYAMRIANTTGCAVGAIVVGGGSGYTAAPTVTPSAGGSMWQAIVGGAVSTAAVIQVAGSGYQYPPILWIDNPPYPGIQATGYTTISNGTISAVTIDNQGAGYTTAPTAVVFNDFRDGVGSGGQVTLSLTASGAITGVLCTNHGNPITSGTIPTLAFGSGTATATVIMDWTVNSVTISTAGAGYTSAAANVMATGAGGYVSATPTYVGTNANIDYVRWRAAQIAIVTNASGGLASSAIIDGGRYQAIPTAVIQNAQAYTANTLAVLALAMGGQTATVFISPAGPNS